AKLELPQSYVSKYERGERRLDVIEFLQVAQVLEIDPLAFIEELLKYQRRCNNHYSIC
ncbi:helix-turn-helix transcriptional regulator, partial [Nostoc sp. HG1]|nr:helix-turn-helix transcriptional regulator [Nostoc sp. HG1]